MSCCVLLLTVGGGARLGPQHLGCRGHRGRELQPLAAGLGRQGPRPLLHRAVLGDGLPPEVDGADLLALGTVGAPHLVERRHGVARTDLAGVDGVVEEVLVGQGAVLVAQQPPAPYRTSPELGLPRDDGERPGEVVTRQALRLVRGVDVAVEAVDVEREGRPRVLDGRDERVARDVDGGAAVGGAGRCRLTRRGRRGR